MSWSGTVTCSHCYTQGHNKRSCPQWKERLAVQAAEGDTYAADKIRRNETKTCSFCHNSYHVDDPLKHNSRTCGWRKRAERSIVSETIRVRKGFYARASKMGLHPGALVQWTKNEYTANGYEDITHLGIVDSIEWSSTIPNHVIAEDSWIYVPMMYLTEVGGENHDRKTHQYIPVEICDLNDVLLRVEGDEGYNDYAQQKIKERNGDSKVAGPVFPDTDPHLAPCLLDPKKVAKEACVKELVQHENNYGLDRKGPPAE